MEHDEHEMLVEFSEMTAFDFNSKEFQKVKKDYVECKNIVFNLSDAVEGFVNRFRIAQSY